jgi:hypothetical protein
MFSFRGVGLALAASVALVGGCGAAVTPAPLGAVYVGRVEGSDLALAVVVDGEQLVAYVCGGARTFDSHTAWYRGARTPGGASAELVGPRGALRLVWGDSDAEGVFVDANGQSFRWQIARVSEGSRAGLYDRSEPGCRAGAIVLDERGAESSVQGVACDPAGRRSQVTPIMPLVGRPEDGLALRLRAPSRVLVVRPVRPRTSER